MQFDSMLEDLIATTFCSTLEIKVRLETGLLLFRSSLGIYNFLRSGLTCECFKLSEHSDAFLIFDETKYMWKVEQSMAGTQSALMCHH